MESPLGSAWNVSAKPVVQGIDLGEFIAIFGSAGIALKRTAQEFHVSGRKQRARAAWLCLRGIGIAHRVSL